MAESILFPSLAFKYQESEFADIFRSEEIFRIKGQPTEYVDKLPISAAVRTTESNNIPWIVKAVQRYYYIHQKYEKDKYNKSNFGGYLISKDAKFILAEYYDGCAEDMCEEDKDYTNSPKIISSYNAVTGKFMAVCVDGYGNEKPFVLRGEKTSVRAISSSHSSAALFLPIIALAVENDSEVRIAYNKYAMGVTLNDREQAAREMALICDNIYRRIKWCDDIGVDGIKTNIPSPNITKLNASAVGDFLNGCDYDLVGSISLLKASTTSAATSSILSLKIESIKDSYNPDPERVLTPEEELLIPSDVENYQLTSEIKFVGEHIKKTSSFKTPFRNFLFRGGAGTGKSEAVKCLAYAMHRPYMFVTCSADTETYDLTMQVLPDVVDDNGKNLGSVEQLTADYPSVMDISLNPVLSYQKITGVSKEDADENDCLMAIVSKVSASIKDKGQGLRFKYVDSPLVQAIKNGYVCEIQEPTVLMKAGVLVGLNALFDKTSAVRLMTGEIIQRHPDAVVIMTTNSGYEGCRAMNQSIISRMNLVVDFEMPSDTVLADRIATESGYNDYDTIRKMLKVMHAVQNQCNIEGADDGSIGVRELIDWAKSILVTDDPYISGKYTLLGSATADDEIRVTLLNCLESQFAPIL